MFNVVWWQTNCSSWAKSKSTCYNDAQLRYRNAIESDLNPDKHNTSANNKNVRSNSIRQLATNIKFLFQLFISGKNANRKCILKKNWCNWNKLELWIFRWFYPLTVKQFLPNEITPVTDWWSIWSKNILYACRTL